MEASRGFVLRGLSDAGRAAEDQRTLMRPASETHYETGRVGFLAVLCEERRLRDPKAAYLSKGRVNPAPDPGW
jgi:hypothetical protein